MSSLPLLLLVLLLSLSSYSCNARHLGVVHDASGKELEKGSLERASIPVKPVQQGEQEKPLNVKDGTDERSLGATTEDRSESEALSRDVKGTRGVVSGIKNGLSAIDMGLLQTTKLVETGRRARRVLGSGSGVGQPAGKREENVQSNETDVDEDIVPMDYEPPHSKPPIHNESP